MLVVMLATVPLASPHPGLTGPRSIAITVAFVVYRGRLDRLAAGRLPITG